MPIMNHKVNGFTLQELVVVMVITTIVISISMVVLNLVQQQTLKISKTYATATELRLFEKTLRNDMVHFSFYAAKDQLIGVSEENEVIYGFEDKFILRNQDTLKLKIEKSIFLLENEIVFSGVIDAWDVTISGRKMFFKNRKSASYKMDKLWHLN